MPHHPKVAISARSLAAAIAGLLLLAGPAGAQPSRSSDIGPIAQAKVGVRLSVRPMVRLASVPSSRAVPAGTSPVCLWSNLDPGRYALRGEYSNGRTADLAPPSAIAGSCENAGMAVTPADTGEAGQGRLVMLMIEGR